MAILIQRKRVRLFVIAWLVLFMAGSVVLAQSADEYEVKAAFLYNFTKFVEWPAVEGRSFAICILGDDPFGAAIDRLTNGKTANGRPIEIRRLKETGDARLCQIVFVRSLEKSKSEKLIGAVQEAHVLTVGENEDFLRVGGIVYLSAKDKVSVVINNAAAERAGLKISAKLLSIATTFKSEQRAGK